MQEIWKPIPGIPGYEASSLGRVKSRFRVLKGTQNKGYLWMNFRRNGKRVVTGAHRAIALAFHPQKDGKAFVNHINGDRADNRPENLEWVDKSENTIHGIQVLGRKNLVVTEDEVRKMRTAFEWNFTVREIARAFQRNRDTVRDIVTRRHWRFTE